MAIAIDPVCGMEVDTATSQLSHEHDGTTYWFCGRGCLLDFQDDPAEYLTGAPPDGHGHAGDHVETHGTDPQS